MLICAGLPSESISVLGWRAYSSVSRHRRAGTRLNKRQRPDLPAQSRDSTGRPGVHLQNKRTAIQICSFFFERRSAELSCDECRKRKQRLTAGPARHHSEHGFRSVPAVAG